MASESALSLPSHASQSSKWGSTGFKGCRYCRRDRSFPNPVVEARPEKPHLQFKSDRHAECWLCTGKLRRCNPDLSTSEAKSQYAKRLADDETSYLKHMTDLEAYEGSVQTGPGSKRRRTNRSDKVGNKDQQHCSYRTIRLWEF